MAKRTSNIEKMATLARKHLAECKDRCKSLQGQLNAADEEYKRARLMVDNLPPELFADAHANGNGDALPAIAEQQKLAARQSLAALNDVPSAAEVAGVPPIEPPVDELDASGLSDVTAAKLRKLGLVTAWQIHEACGAGSLHKLADMGVADDRLVPREISAIGRWVEKAI